jgi:hypothetical protein
MARGGTAQRKRSRELPPPLPPEHRTIGQLVGETLRAYGNRFGLSLAIGVPVALLNAFVRAVSGLGQVAVAAGGALLLSASYVLACAVVSGKPLRSRAALVAYVVGVAVFVPFPFLAAGFVLPGLIWLAFVGLAVPVAFVEGLGARASLSRAVRLARADFIHVLGGLATLVLLVFITQAVLFFVLREVAENTQVAAAMLASVVVSPLVFLGAALLYADQEARLRSRDERRKERDADVPDAVHPHRKRRANAARKPRPPT